MKKAPKQKDWLTANEAAEVIGISRQAVTKAIRADRLAAKEWGRFYLIRRVDAEQFVKGAPGRKKKKKEP